ncbi:MAG: PqqD family protein [Bacteroidales bacterium]|nr:PqqD family protein [Bacteroidales bacterium]
MKIKDGFILRKICGQSVISGEGAANVNFSKLVSLNETASFLFSKVVGGEFTPESMADLLTGEYEVDYERALSDCRSLCDQWKEIGILED